MVGTFHSATETLTITDKPEGGGDEQQQAAAGSAAGRRRSFQQQQQGSSGDASWEHEQDGPGSSSAALGLNNEKFNLRVWLDHMQGKVINRQHIPKTQLPLEVGGAGGVVVAARCLVVWVTQGGHRCLGHHGACDCVSVGNTRVLVTCAIVTSGELGVLSAFVWNKLGSTVGRLV